MAFCPERVQKYERGKVVSFPFASLLAQKYDIITFGLLWSKVLLYPDIKKAPLQKERCFFSIFQ
jgi:hypothetical protein